MRRCRWLWLLEWERTYVGLGWYALVTICKLGSLGVPLHAHSKWFFIILWVGLSGLLYHFALRKSRGRAEAFEMLCSHWLTAWLSRVVGNFPPGWWMYVSMASSGLGYLLGNGTLQTSLPPFLHRFYSVTQVDSESFGSSPQPLQCGGT